MLEAQSKTALVASFYQRSDYQPDAFREGTIFPSLRNMRVRRHGEVPRLECGSIDDRRKEPYIIAITLADALRMAPVAGKYSPTIMPDTEVLEKARSGIYRLSELKTLSPQQLQRYFMRGTRGRI
ncbi:hypothetical protein KCP77_12390 [Salmonella enterica subsp. enterica]|nr:hypothetical protein KCP77_12390 [Salmonella enterica subsp. enterica]